MDNQNFRISQFATYSFEKKEAKDIKLISCEEWDATCRTRPIRRDNVMTLSVWYRRKDTFWDELGAGAKTRTGLLLPSHLQKLWFSDKTLQVENNNAPFDLILNPCVQELGIDTKSITQQQLAQNDRQTPPTSAVLINCLLSWPERTALFQLFGRKSVPSLVMEYAY